MQNLFHMYDLASYILSPVKYSSESNIPNLHALWQST